MNQLQHAAVDSVRRLGYACEYRRMYRNGIACVDCARKLRAGTLTLLVRPDGTYRDAGYLRWNEYETRAQQWVT
jgi:hypothetical protein